jgi:hypothetical protein
MFFQLKQEVDYKFHSRQHSPKSRHKIPVA